MHHLCHYLVELVVGRLMFFESWVFGQRFPSGQIWDLRGDLWPLICSLTWNRRAPLPFLSCLSPTPVHGMLVWSSRGNPCLGPYLSHPGVTGTSPGRWFLSQPALDVRVEAPRAVQLWPHCSVDPWHQFLDVVSGHVCSWGGWFLCMSHGRTFL